VIENHTNMKSHSQDNLLKTIAIFISLQKLF